MIWTGRNRTSGLIPFGSQSEAGAAVRADLSRAIPLPVQFLTRNQAICLNLNVNLVTRSASQDLEVG